MITSKEAHTKVNYAMDHSDLVHNLIDNIYNSRGTCQKCVEFKPIYAKDYGYCKLLNFSCDKNWFCADFKEITND